MKNKHHITTLRALALALSTAGLLAACGGGGGGGSSNGGGSNTGGGDTGGGTGGTGGTGGNTGGGGSTTPQPAPFKASELQGRWSLTGATADTSYTAIVLPGSSGTANVWLLSQSLSSLGILSVNDQAAVSGKVYPLGTAATPGAATGAVVADLSASLKTMTLSGLASQGLTLTQQDTLSQPASLADSAGSWTGSVGNGARTLSLSIAADTGALSGASTTGCTYTGSLSPLSTASAFTSTLSESCPDGSTTRFDGIATLNSTKNRLTLVGATPNQTSAVVLLLSK